MAAFKEPSFQDRAAAAGRARQKALDHLKTRAPVDPEVMAQRRKASDMKEQSRSEERAAKAGSAAAAKAERASARAAALADAEAAADLKAARLKPASAEEMKAARDARYAARKARK